MAPPPKDDDPWAHATLFKGISHKPEAAPAPAAPKATLGQLSKAAPATVPSMPTYTATPSYPMGAPVVMGAPMMGYVPAGAYVMPTAYGAPGNPALR